MPGITHKKEITRRELLCLLANFCLVTVVFSVFPSSDRSLSIFFSSDTLYLPSIYKDLFTDGNTPEGWHLNPSPNFFPDMLVYFILMFASGGFLKASYLFAAAQYMLTGYLLGKIFRSVFPQAPSFFIIIINLFLSFFLLETFFFTKDFYFSFYILSNSYHTGSFVMALLCLHLTLLYARQPRTRLIITLFVLEFLAVLSDRMFIVEFTGPVVILVCFFFRFFGRKASLLILTTNLLATVVGLYTFQCIVNGGYVFVEAPGKIFEFDNISSSLSTFAAQIKEIAVHFGFQNFCILLYFISVIGLLILLPFISKTQPLLKFMIFYVLIFSVFVFSSPIINGAYIGFDCLRYSVYPFFLFPLNLALIGFYFYKKPMPVVTVTTIVLFIVMLIVSFTQFSQKGLNNYLSYYPQSARELDSVADKEPLLNGIADYWEAKKTTMFSKKGVRVYSAYYDGYMFNHVANDNWYYSNTIFNFVLLNGMNDTNLVKKKLKPIREINCKKLKLLEVKPFKYVPEKGYEPVDYN